MMKLEGIIETDFRFALVQIAFGEKDGKDFGQVSFPIMGDMHNDVDEAKLTDTTADFIFDINGMPSNIHLEKNNDQWQGTFEMKSISLKLDLTIKQISDEPDFAEHAYIIPQINIEKLRQHNEYINEPCKEILKYELNNQKVFNYVKEKGIDVENHHNFSTVCALQKKVAEFYHHDGANYSHDKENIGTIAQIEFAQKQNNYTNCRGMAIILSGVLRAYGFQENVVECHSDDVNSPKIHVVCEVFCEDLNKTVLLDPSNNLIYYLNSQPLSLIELREAIINDQSEKITLNEDSSHNGEDVSIIQLLAYMSKNLMFLVKGIKSDETHELRDENRIRLVPADYLDKDYPKASLRTNNIQEFYITK